MEILIHKVVPYTFQTQNAKGSDSTATLQLTISNSSQSVSNRTCCDEYSWNNVNYTQSGTYQYNTINSSGCDSTAVLNFGHTCRIVCCKNKQPARLFSGIMSRTINQENIFSDNQSIWVRQHHYFGFKH
ncbi:MAG: hypothetical protein IPN15_20375 [Saprospiraceae bacterium]|nr:hypothetical protein [Candidatus Vicinibacter affinis]